MLQIKNIPHDTLTEALKADIAASFQQAVVDTLVNKTLRAINDYGISTLVVAGGVAANKSLRQSFHEESLKKSLNLFIPSKEFCTDNAAMIAYVGYKRMTLGERDNFNMSVFASGYSDLI